MLPLLKRCANLAIRAAAVSETGKPSRLSPVLTAVRRVPHAALPFDGGIGGRTSPPVVLEPDASVLAPRAAAAAAVAATVSGLRRPLLRCRLELR